MALYPSIFVLYLGKFSPGLTAGWNGWKAYAWSLAVVALCSLWNLRGAPAVGEGSVWLFAMLLLSLSLSSWFSASFAAFLLHPAVQWSNSTPLHASGFGPGSAFSTAVLVAMWNYMGWDNASTVAQEVEESAAQLSARHDRCRHPHGITYILPLAAMALAGLLPLDFRPATGQTPPDRSAVQA